MCPRERRRCRRRRAPHGPASLLRLLFCLLFGLIFCSGCSTPAGVRGTDALPRSAARLEAGAWFFRHKLTLDFTERDLAFGIDGLMRLDTRAEIVHAAGVAGLGMQMFEMTVAREWEVVAYMHPVLAKMPGIGEHMARCIRQIWFDCLLNMPQTVAAEQKTWSFEAEGDREAGLWPGLMRYRDKRVPFTLTVRLLQAEQEDTP